MNKKQKWVAISLVVLLLSLGSFYGVKAMNLTSPQVGNNKPIVADKVMGDRLTSGEFNRILSLLKNFFVSTTNNVGIGGEPDGKLTITGGADINAANGVGQGHLVLEDNAGDATGWKLRMDTNEMQVSNNGVAGSFTINPFGGSIDLASSATADGHVFMGKDRAVEIKADGSVLSDKYCDRNGLNCKKISEIADISGVMCGTGLFLQGFDASGVKICKTREELLRNQGCEAGEILRGWNAAGQPICRTDNQILEWQRCTNADQVLRGFDGDGNPICREDAGVTKSGMKGVICADGQVLKGFRADNGNPICRNETAVTKDGMKGVTCADGQVLKGFRADNGNPICRNETAVTKDGMKNVGCADGQVLKGFNASGNPICRNDANIAAKPTTYVRSGECKISNSNAGCSGEITCDNGDLAIAARAVCQLEVDTYQNIANVPWGAIEVKGNDDGSSSWCKVGAGSEFSRDTTFLGAAVVSGSKIGFGCRDHDDNGGDCAIRAAIQCLDL